jgi:hypothetical protein
MSDTTYNTKKYNCAKCSFSSNNKKDYERHLTTNKHLQTPESNLNKFNEINKYICCCGNNYSCFENLSEHKKNCTEKHFNSSAVYKQILESVRDKNRELYSMIEHSKEAPHHISHTNIVNLNFFINDSKISEKHFVLGKEKNDFQSI